ncbi:MAG TPA: tetratricopeptide repeat protein [Polyangiaceae bacterium]
MAKDEGARVLRSTRVRVALQSIGLALLMASIATLSILIFRGQFRSFHLFRGRSRAVSAARAQAPNLLHDQALVKVAPEPAASVEPPKNQPAPQRYQSPSELFAEANLARERGDLDRALRISQELEQFFPSTPEGITTHLSLGVIYLQQGDPNRALGELELYRTIGNPEMMAEALWGQAQALKQLNRPHDEREILSELLKSYPRSVYVAAAKERLNALPPGP